MYLYIYIYTQTVKDEKIALCEYTTGYYSKFHVLHIRQVYISIFILS